MKTEKQLNEMAAEANPYKIGSPYGEETRGYKIGFVDGYKERDKEEKQKVVKKKPKGCSNK